MQQQTQPIESASITNSFDGGIVHDSWNQARTLEQLQSFVSGRLSAHDDIDELFS